MKQITEFISNKKVRGYPAMFIDERSKRETKVSIIFLDWSCRESFHSIDYLNNQTVSREQCEIIWIEYYSRRSLEIEVKFKEYEATNVGVFVFLIYVSTNSKLKQ